VVLVIPGELAKPNTGDIEIIAGSSFIGTVELDLVKTRDYNPSKLAGFKC
jgi:hypothetical protein